MEITVSESNEVEARDVEFDEHVFEALAEEGYTASSPLEFNLYLTGLA